MPNAVVKVADVMRTSLHMVNGLASVQDAIAEMSRLGVSSLLIERRHAGVVTLREDVVDEQSYAHSPVRRTQQGIDERHARVICLDQVVLRVDRQLGPLGQEQSCGQRLDAVDQRVETGRPLVLRGRQLRDTDAQPGLLAVCDRHGFGSRVIEVDRRAPGHK